MHGPWGPPPSWLPGILAYHKVGTPELGGTWCTASQFAAHLDALQAAGYHSLSIQELQARLPSASRGAAPADAATVAQASAVRQTPSRSLLLTFDDAFESFATHAWPALRQRGLRALVFVVTGYVGRTATWDLRLPGRRVPHLSWSALRDLVQDGVEIGSHTVQHRDVRSLSQAQLHRELQESRQDLEDQLGCAVRSVSWPFGRWNLEACRVAQACGYTLGFAMSPSGRNDAVQPLALPRRGVYITDAASAVLDKVDAQRAGFWFQDLFTRGVSAVAALSTRFQKAG